MKRIASLAVAVAALATGMTVALAGGAAGAATAGGTLPTINVNLTGKTIAVSGALQSGAVDIHTTVSGEPVGSVTLVRLNPGVTTRQFFALLSSPAGKDVNNVTSVGSIVFGAEAPKGTSDAQTTLQPGDYVALDTTRQNPPFPTTTFTITTAASPATLPAADATYHLIDFAFKGPSRLRDGETVRVVDEGWEAHMADAIGVRSKAVGRRVMRLLLAGKDKKAARLATHDFFGLASVVTRGAIVQQTLHAKPGYYVLACFMDTQDGREHSQLGMLRLVRVVR